MTRDELEILQDTDLVAFMHEVESFDPMVTKDNYEDVVDAMLCEAEKVPYTDGSHGHVNGFGILEDCDVVNTLISNEKKFVEPTRRIAA